MAKWVGSAIAGLAALFAGAALAQQPAAEQLLDRLVGDWRMVGTVRGNPVEYRMQGRRTLGGKFVELHMVDVAEPPKYEARVFIGHDPKKDELIVHWIDKTGAANSIPHATGSASTNTLRFQFAYPDGAFRDTFSYRPPDGSWDFVLEAADGKGGWTLFARYIVTRAAR